jgi:hypothetical protein
MADLLLDIVNYWIAEGLVTADSTDAFRDTMPDSPDNCVALVEYLGETAFMANVANRSVQVRVRNTDHEDGKAKIVALYNSVYSPETGIRVIDFTVSRWGIVKARNYPYMLNKDESERYIFVFNMGIVTPGDD